MCESSTFTVRGALKGQRASGTRRASSSSEGRRTGRVLAMGLEFEPEHICWDPKGGDLCLNRMKPRETLVEVRSDVDVQITRLIWV